MFSKLDSLMCQDRKRDCTSRKSSFLIRDILEDGDDGEFCPSEEHPPILGLPHGIAVSVWEQPLMPATYPVVAPLSHEEQVLLASRGHPARSSVCSGSLSLCCLNCPPQSWHTGFTDIIAPTPTATCAILPSAGAGATAAATGVSWSCLGGTNGPDLTGTTKDGTKGGPPRKVRRNRTVFTELQLMGLERRFDCQKYLSTPDRAELARALGLTQLQVKTWYQNRRMKWKKQVMQGGCTVPPTKPKGRPKKNSIPSLNESQHHTGDLVIKDTF